MSMLPASLTMRSIICFTATESVRSQSMKVASPPLSRMPAAAASPGSTAMSMRYALAPASANLSAESLPMPRDPPVTTATCPEKSKLVLPMKRSP